MWYDSLEVIHATHEGILMSVGVYFRAKVGQLDLARTRVGMQRFDREHCNFTSQALIGEVKTPLGMM